MASLQGAFAVTFREGIINLYKDPVINKVQGILSYFRGQTVSFREGRFPRKSCQSKILWVDWIKSTAPFPASVAGAYNCCSHKRKQEAKKQPINTSFIQFGYGFVTLYTVRCVLFWKKNWTKHNEEWGVLDFSDFCLVALLRLKCGCFKAQDIPKPSKHPRFTWTWLFKFHVFSPSTQLKKKAMQQNWWWLFPLPDSVKNPPVLIYSP